MVSLRVDALVVPPEGDRGTRMAVIAAIDPAFDATVSGKRSLLEAFSGYYRLVQQDCREFLL